MTDLRFTSWHGLARCQPGLGGQHDAAHDLIGGGLVGVEPGFQGGTRPSCSTVAVISGLFSLSFVWPWNMGIADEDRQDADDAFADVLGGDVQALDLDLVGFHVVADGLGDAALEAALVRAAGRGADAVDVGTDRLLGRFGPLQGDFHLVTVSCTNEQEGRLGDGRLLPFGYEPCQKSGMPPGWVRSKVSLVMSFLNVIFSPLWMYDMSSRWALIRFGSNCVRLEDLRIRLEVDGGTVAAERAELFQLAGRVAALEGLFPFVAVTANGGDELLRQGIDDRRADAVQAAGSGGSCRPRRTWPRSGAS